MSVRDDFLKILINYKNIEKKQKKLFILISNMRVLVFLTGLAIVAILLIKGYKTMGFTVLLAFLSSFIFLIIQHNRIEDELKRTQCRIEINQNYLGRIDGNWINFIDNGNSFIDPNHPYTSDLDIFGPKSLFQWINVGNTFYGRKLLKDLLSCPQKDMDSIRGRQNAVRELANKLNFCQELQCEGMLVRGIGHDPKNLLAYAESLSKMFKREWIKSIFYIIPGLTIISMVLTLLKFQISPYLPLALVTLQIIMTGMGYKSVSKVLGTVYQFKNSVEVYGKLFRLIEQEDFSEKYLSDSKSDLFHKGKPVSYQIKRLEKIVNAIDVRYSSILYIIFNFTLLWDFHCVFALEKWKEQNGKLIRNWLLTVGTFEAISSLAVVLRINPRWCFPEFADQELKFVATELGHPLIVPDKRVCNDISIRNNISIITGSNMSGKTTLLRTIGINLVLAYAGAPVCAKRLECSVMDIFTSMRVIDDLNSGISTFYAELLRIKMIIDYAHKKQPMLFLIDEIFRGTNSKDRNIGAKNVLISLSKYWIIGLISTHDFELCELEKEKNACIKNYHFTESYINNEIKFDYKLRSGRCKTSNARYLMQMVGIQMEDNCK